MKVIDPHPNDLERDVFGKLTCIPVHIHGNHFAGLAERFVCGELFDLTVKRLTPFEGRSLSKKSPASVCWRWANTEKLFTALSKNNNLGRIGISLRCCIQVPPVVF